MNEIFQIPTEHNVTRLLNIFLNAKCQRNLGMPVSEREVRQKELAYQKLYVKTAKAKYCEVKK